MKDPFTPLDDIGMALEEHSSITNMILDITKDQVVAAIQLLTQHGVPSEEIRAAVLTPFQARFDEVNRRLDAGAAMFAKGKN